MKKYSPRSHERREFCHPTIERNGRNAQLVDIPEGTDPTKHSASPANHINVVTCGASACSYWRSCPITSMVAASAEALGSAAQGQRSGAHLLERKRQTMDDGVRMRMTDVLATQMPIAPTEAFGHHIQQSVQVIVSPQTVDERGELSGIGHGRTSRRRPAKIASARAGRDRRGRNGQGRVGLGIHDAAENRRLSQPVVRQVGANRPRHLDPVWCRGRARIQGPLRSLGPGC